MRYIDDLIAQLEALKSIHGNVPVATVSELGWLEINPSARVIGSAEAERYPWPWTLEGTPRPEVIVGIWED